MQQTKMLKSL